MSLDCQELWKWAVKVIGNERCDGVLFAIGNDEKVAGSGSIPVVTPSRARKDTRLRTLWSGHGMFLIRGCVHLRDVELTAAFIENKSHVLDQTFILNSGFDWVICCLNESL